MDWFGGLLGGLGSVISGFMNTSSQQAINAANIQQAQWAATGGNLPGLVANANRAGISPLAVLGQHAPSMPQAISGAPGAGLAEASRILSQIKDPHQVRMDSLAEQLGQSQIYRSLIETSNAKLEGDRMAMIVARARQDPTINPVTSEPNWGERLLRLFGAGAEGADQLLPSAGSRISGAWSAMNDWANRQPGLPGFNPPGFIPTQ